MMSSSWSVSAKSAIIAFLFLFGCAINTFAYSSMLPFVIAVIFFTAGAGFLFFLKSWRGAEFMMFSTVFSVCWTMAGIAAVYANYLNDPFQNSNDAFRFYILSSGAIPGADIETIRSMSEGSGAIVIWRFVYDMFANFGIVSGRYIGILVNVLVVAFTGVVAVKIARLIYGDDNVRLDRLVLLFHLCGIFWLFASIHVRDAFVLLAVTLSVYLWMVLFAKKNFRSFLLLLLGTFIEVYIFAYLRAEFVFVPMAMLFAGLFVLLFFSRARGKIKYIVSIPLLIGGLIAGVLFVQFQEQLMSFIYAGNLGYGQQMGNTAADDSLGMTLIVNQVLPVRLLLGVIYLFLFPIPFWSGFQLESVYHVFKSFNVIYFYFLLPLFFLSVKQLFLNKSLRNPGLIFNLVLVIGFSIVIVATSFESRHLGAFLVPFLIVSLLPDVTTTKDRKAYKKLLLVFLLMMLFIHLAWGYLKFF